MSCFNKARDNVPDGLSSNGRQEPGRRPLIEPHLESTEYLELQGDSCRVANVPKAGAEAIVEAEMFVWRVTTASRSTTTAATCSSSSYIATSIRFQQIDGWEDNLAGDVRGHGPKHVVGGAVARHLL